MLTLKKVREHTDELVLRLTARGFEAKEYVERAIAIDAQRRTIQAKLDECQQSVNLYSKEIGQLIQSGKREEAEGKKRQVSALKEEVKALQEQKSEAEVLLREVLQQIPNAPHESVPSGKTADENIVVRAEGEKPQLGEHKLPHWEIAAKLGIINFDLGVKLTGSGFPLYVGAGARLERSLINFFLDENVKAGYLEMMPPIVVNADSAYATGQLPDKEGQMYYMPADDLYLVPTAEVPLTNVYRDVILEESELPKRITAYTPCFRREAGSYGKDVRGLNRLHQFDKVEIVCVERPDQSYDRLEEMVLHVERLLQRLELPYRVVKLCAGDLGFTSALTYDLEVYSAGQGRWLEVSSVSNFEDYQANRLQLRYRMADEKKNALCHTLNGSALALPRIVAALLENNQTSRGVWLPQVLHKWMGVEELLWK